ncbi:hypothetical protein ATJ88_2463 [Isoptericola jiangsuensis]|uniref:Homeodomain-like domain-containing protein n=2 Tax=Isoptericola jiangsuensis TaxID=548579 RepID=A0A2A9EYW4_9MICO|nr:hypothetical protein ATJ88_2463 [Isoptericola jiangsuensis]
MDSTELREQVCTMLAAGLKQRQIALHLGIGQATVSDHKRALVAAGRLPVGRSSTAPVPPDCRGVDPASGPPQHVRTRAEILVEHAELKASTLSMAARTFVEHIVGADEWVTDLCFREQVRSVAGEAVGQALDDLKRIAVDVGVPEPEVLSVSAVARGMR